ncbi:MAG TPA: hypothetical protein GXX48_11175, partial [Ochrobactrum intermedium]|nr:hypothetical protein [Brucella intermedia]
LLCGWRRLGFVGLRVLGLILGGSFGAILARVRIVVFLSGIRFVVGAAVIILFFVAIAVIIPAGIVVVVVLGFFVRGALVFIFGQHKLVAFSLGVGELRKLFFGQSIHNLFSTVAGWG